MTAYAVGQGLLSESALFAESRQTFMEIARIGAGHRWTSTGFREAARRFPARQVRSYQTRQALARTIG